MPSAYEQYFTFHPSPTTEPFLQTLYEEPFTYYPYD